MRARPIVYLSFFFLSFSVVAQERFSNDILSRGFSAIIDGEWHSSAPSWMNNDRLIYIRSAFDDYLQYRNDRTKLDIRHARYNLGYQRYIVSQRPHPDIVRLELNRQWSFFHWRDRNNPRSMRADHRLTSFRLFYERHLAGPFIIESEVEHMKGFRKAVWNGNIGIRFYQPKIEWRWRIASLYYPRKMSIGYDADTIHALNSNHSQAMEFSMRVKDVYRWSVSAVYRIENENGRRQRIDSYASLAANNYELFRGTIAYAINAIDLFAGYKQEIWDETIYGHKNSMQYAKFNLPDMKFQEWMSGGRMNIKKGEYIECMVRYQNGKTHTGLIVDGWPFTGGLGGLLGVKNYSSLDGKWLMLSLQTKYRKPIELSHILEPKISLIIFDMEGVYRFRKQDAFFQVIDRGKYSTDMNNCYLFPDLFYQYQYKDWFVSLQMGQLIQIYTKDKTTRNINQKTRGGLTVTVSMGISGI